jgi:hypothetical protein
MYKFQDTALLTSLSSRYVTKAAESNRVVNQNICRPDSFAQVYLSANDKGSQVFSRLLPILYQRVDKGGYILMTLEQRKLSSTFNAAFWFRIPGSNVD